MVCVPSDSGALPHPAVVARLPTAPADRVGGGAVVGGAVVGGAVLGGAVLGGAVLGGAVLGGAVVGGAVVGPPPPPVNCHQFTLNSEPLPPVKRRYRSWVPVAPLTGQETVVQVCQPPVPATVQVPTVGPVLLSRCSSIRPPLVADATRALKDAAPEPKATPLTLIQSPFSICETFNPPSLDVCVSTPDSNAIVSASCRTYGSSVPIWGAPVDVMLIVGKLPSAL